MLNTPKLIIANIIKTTVLINKFIAFPFSDSFFFILIRDKTNSIIDIIKNKAHIFFLYSKNYYIFDRFILLIKYFIYFQRFYFL